MDSSFLPHRAIIMGRRQRPPAPCVPLETSLESPESPSTNAQRADSLEAISAELQGCMRCGLCEQRKTIVLGEGNPLAELVFVGETPDEQDDLEGRPFVGPAGQLLDKMIQAIGLRRDQVFLTHLIKCRPPGHRGLDAQEIATCSRFLLRQLDVIRPKVIVSLGGFATQTLLQSEAPLAELRGNFVPYRGAKLMPTFHPAHMLRNPEGKRDVWADLQQVAAELKLQLPKRS